MEADVSLADFYAGAGVVFADGGCPHLLTEEQGKKFY